MGLLFFYSHLSLFCDSEEFLNVLYLINLLMGSISLDLEEDEVKQLLHIPTRQRLDVIRWNRANQDEVNFHSAHNDV